MEKVMMKCGHAANALTHPDKKPCCVICAPNPDAYIVVASPDLTGRKSRCAYYRQCETEVDSKVTLPFFEHKPDQEYDLHYCGCRGWD